MSSSNPNPSSAWDGTLSPHAFHVAAKSLAERWARINKSLPHWTWVPCTTPTEEEEGGYLSLGYLSLENVHHHLRVSQCEPSIVESEESTDGATLVQNYNDEAHIYDFHIVYSFSYRVPVLYFRGYRCDGQPLGLDDIEKDIPNPSLRILRESKWTYMTREEHPYLHRPWYTLHPCGTSDWMRLLLCDTMSAKDPEIQWYLLSWLSVVGQAVGIEIPFELQIK